MLSVRVRPGLRVLFLVVAVADAAVVVIVTVPVLQLQISAASSEDKKDDDCHDKCTICLCSFEEDEPVRYVFCSMLKASLDGVFTCAGSAERSECIDTWTNPTWCTKCKFPTHSSRIVYHYHMHLMVSLTSGINFINITLLLIRFLIV